jgi:ADP-ribosylglycohydrolase
LPGRALRDGNPEPRPGRHEGGGYGFKPGEWSDDTAGAIAVALGKSVPLEVAKGLLSWYWTRPPDIGISTRAVLGKVTSPRGMLAASKAHGMRMHAMRKPPGWNEGGPNGSLMRTGPVCLPYLGDRPRIAQAAREISDLTHFDPTGYTADSCVIWSLAIADAVERGTKFSAEQVADGIELIPDAARRGYWEHVIDEALCKRPATFARNSGGCVGALSVALSAIAHADGLEQALQDCVAAGGDTDTTGAICGALLGAIHGASAVPQRWVKVMHGWPGYRAADLGRLALQAASGG